MCRWPHHLCACYRRLLTRGGPALLHFAGIVAISLQQREQQWEQFAPHIVQPFVHKSRTLVNVLVVDDCMQFSSMSVLVWWVVWTGDEWCCTFLSSCHGTMLLASCPCGCQPLMYLWLELLSMPALLASVGVVRGSWLPVRA